MNAVLVLAVMLLLYSSCEHSDKIQALERRLKELEDRIKGDDL